jgi:hypothetical protein
MARPKIREINALMARIDHQFKKDLDEISINRIKFGNDKYKRSERRITKAITRHPLWPQIKTDLAKIPFAEEKF